MPSLSMLSSSDLSKPVVNVVRILPPCHRDSCHEVPHHDPIHGVEKTVVKDAGVTSVMTEECRLLEIQSVHYGSQNLE